MQKLELHNVIKRFGNNTVCNGINLNVEQGQMVCLIGASGAGKSTLLRCINLTFITAMRELSLIILLISPGNMVLTGLIFSYQEQDMAQHSSAVTLALVLIIITISVIVRVMSRSAGVGRLNVT